MEKVGCKKLTSTQMQREKKEADKQCEAKRPVNERERNKGRRVRGASSPQFQAFRKPRSPYISWATDAHPNPHAGLYTFLFCLSSLDWVSVSGNQNIAF